MHHTRVLFAIIFIFFIPCMVYASSLSFKYNDNSIKIETISDKPIMLVPLNEVATFYKIDFQWDIIQEKIVLLKDGIKINLILGNNHALVNLDKLILLSSPPVISKGAIALSLQDIVNIISELMPNCKVSYDSSKSLIEASGYGSSYYSYQRPYGDSEFDNTELTGNFELKYVVIDPGHGGHDPGATRSGIYEKDIVLDVGLRLARLLRSQSKINVVMTRDTDIFIPLHERTAIANRYPPDSTLFISLHCNASRSREGGYGAEAYVFNLEATDNEARALAARENMGEPMDLTRILSHCYHTGTEPYSLDIAERVRKSIRSKVDLTDRGTRRAAFYVLAGTKMPGILLEIAYISNSRERAMLNRESFRQEIAEALFSAIIDFDRATSKSLAKEKTN